MNQEPKFKVVSDRFLEMWQPAMNALANQLRKQEQERKKKAKKRRK